MPSRRTTARGVVRTARRSSARFARISCTMPTAVLAATTIPKRASCGGPTTTITTRSAPRMALNRVATLLRTIIPTVRLGPRACRLTWPASFRSAASPAASPLRSSAGGPTRRGVAEATSAAPPLRRGGPRPVLQATSAGPLGRAGAGAGQQDGDGTVPGERTGRAPEDRLGDACATGAGGDELIALGGRILAQHLGGMAVKHFELPSAPGGASGEASERVGRLGLVRLAGAVGDDGHRRHPAQAVAEQRHDGLGGGDAVRRIVEADEDVDRP